MELELAADERGEYCRQWESCVEQSSTPEQLNVAAESAFLAATSQDP